MIACIVPSRGRPGNIVELIEAWSDTITGDVGSGIAFLVVCVDDDDPTLAGYQAIELPPWCSMMVGKRLRLGGTLNAASGIFARHTPIVGFMGDDHRPRTIGWDRRIAEALVPGIDGPPLGIAYGNDLIQGKMLPTAVFMDSRIVRTLGWMVYPGMTHLFFDNLWKRLGEELGTLTYLDDVVIEHCHPLAGKAEWDDGYAEVNSDATWDHDQLLYVEWVQQHMATDIARLKAVL